MAETTTIVHANPWHIHSPSEAPIYSESQPAIKATAVRGVVEKRAVGFSARQSVAN
jgi:hypothetical protein